jgi:hypothetical protein
MGRGRTVLAVADLPQVFCNLRNSGECGHANILTHRPSRTYGEKTVTLPPITHHPEKGYQQRESQNAGYVHYRDEHARTNTKSQPVKQCKQAQYHRIEDWSQQYASDASMSLMVVD